MARPSGTQPDSPHNAYLAYQQLLAQQLCSAASCGRQTTCCTAGIQSLFPGCCYLSVAWPAPIRERALLISGNLAAGERLPPAVIPMQNAAAGMAFMQRRWLHVGRQSVTGLSSYYDLGQALQWEGCESVLCVPITLQPESWAASKSAPSPPPRAVGVLTVGLDSHTMVDAGLLTSFFTLAYLMAPHAAHIVRTMLLMQHSRQAAWAATAAEGVSHTYHSGGEEGESEGVVGPDSCPPPELLAVCQATRAFSAPATAAAAARPPQYSSKGLELMLAFATRRGGGKPASARACGTLLVVSCVLYCFHQLGSMTACRIHAACSNMRVKLLPRLKRSPAVMGAVTCACLIGAATLSALVFPGLGTSIHSLHSIS